MKRVLKFDQFLFTFYDIMPRTHKCEKSKNDLDSVYTESFLKQICEK